MQQIGMLPGTLSNAVLARRDHLPVKPAPVTLTGPRATLRPFTAADAEALHAATCGQPFALGDRRVGAYDPDELVWKWLRASAFRDAAALAEHFLAYAAQPDVLALTVCERGTPVGFACFVANSPADLKVELGNVWYGPIAQQAGVSREATLLMCAHAFALGYQRVEWKCDALNERSRRAARSYGFTFEGIQQAHMIVKGRSRDTAWFRMLAGEWPAIQAAGDAARQAH